MIWRRVRAHCNNQKLLKGAVVLLGVSLLVFTVASSILFNYRRLNYSSRAHAPCGSCSCVCPSERGMFPSASECGENDVKESRLDLLKEQLSLQVTVAKETLARSKALTGDAKKTSLRFSAEAEKCTAGVSACELGRERAEAGLLEERKLAALWEKRARERGWKDGNKVSKALTGDAKKTSLRFSAEAEKCTAGVSACELGRERAEVGLLEECKLAALWEKRARERGWKDGNKVHLHR